MRQRAVLVVVVSLLSLVERGVAGAEEVAVADAVTDQPELEPVQSLQELVELVQRLGGVSPGQMKVILNQTTFQPHATGKCAEVLHGLLDGPTSITLDQVRAMAGGCDGGSADAPPCEWSTATPTQPPPASSSPAQPSTAPRREDQTTPPAIQTLEATDLIARFLPSLTLGLGDGGEGTDARHDAGATVAPSPSPLLAPSPAPSPPHSMPAEPQPQAQRFNFASAQANAKVLAHSPGAQDAGSILVGNRDRYCIFPCSARKWVVVMLDEEILVDEIVLANFEEYSSTFRHFVLLGSAHYPPPQGQWMKLGEWEGQNTHEKQAFKLGSPRWVRYVKVWLRSHYGSERLCTLSTFQVHGKTRFMDFKIDIEELQVDVFQPLEDTSFQEKLNSLKNATSSLGNSSSLQIKLPQLPGDFLAVNTSSLSRGEDGGGGDDAQQSSPVWTGTEQTTGPDHHHSPAVPPALHSDDSILGHLRTIDNETAAVPSPPPSMSPESVSAKGDMAGKDTVFKTLTRKIKALEQRVTILAEYVEQFNAQFPTALTQMSQVAESSKQNFTAALEAVVYASMALHLLQQQNTLDLTKSYDARLRKCQQGVMHQHKLLLQELAILRNEHANEGLGLTMLLAVVMLVLFIAILRSPLVLETDPAPPLPETPSQEPSAASTGSRARRKGRARNRPKKAKSAALVVSDSEPASPLVVPAQPRDNRSDSEHSHSSLRARAYHSASTPNLAQLVASEKARKRKASVPVVSFQGEDSE